MYTQQATFTHTHSQAPLVERGTKKSQESGGQERQGFHCHHHQQLQLVCGPTVGQQ